MAIRFDLTGKRLLVVGASSGIGRGVASLAAAAGARVALAARREAALAEVVAEIEGAGGAAFAVPCDVADADRCTAAVTAAIAELGGLDGFVYAPGISTLSLLQEASQADWRRVLDVNVIGASLVTAAAVDALERDGGRGVFVGSYSVRQSLPGIGLYSTSKVALDGLIEAWRMERPQVEFTRALLGNTAGTEFADGWGREQITELTRTWVERGLFPAPTMMPLESAAEAIVALFAIRGFVDDIAIMPSPRDTRAL